MNNRFILFPLLAALILTGCGQPTIDGSSDEAMEKSLDAIQQGMTPAQKKEFGEAMIAVAFDGENLFTLMASEGDMVGNRMRNRLDGMTANEVIELANQLAVEKETKDAQKAQSEIAELEAFKAKAQQAILQLSAFEVQNARFYYSDSGFMREPIIELTVKNGLDQPISRAYFQGVLKTPGRAVPWVEETFNYSIPGGLEPGESATWKLSPNMFGDWGNAPKDREDMVLTVTPTRLDGPNGEALLDGEFPDYKQERLEKLKASVE